MLISCTSCPVRERRCDTCVVTTFLAMPASAAPSRDALEWDLEDHRVLDTLCAAGLVGPHDAAAATLTRTPYVGLQRAV